MRLWARRIGAVILAAAAVAVWFTMAPEVAERPGVPNHQDSIASALADEALNASSTDTSQQQAVVNGWVARDLLTVIAKQQDDQAQLLAALDDEPGDERPTALLGLLVLGGALALVTSAPTPRRPSVSPGSRPSS